MCGDTRYISWWLLSDRLPRLMHMCENLVKIICRSSRLKANDFQFRDESDFQMMCENTDLGIAENIKHIVLQCPHNTLEVMQCLIEAN